MPATIRVLNPGDTTKPDPFTICIVANPALERPEGSGTFVPDPILTDQALFDDAAARIADALFGRIPGQRELVFDPGMAAATRVVSIFEAPLTAEDKNCLIAEERSSDLLIARRTVFQPFVTRHGLTTDVAYGVTNSATHARASSFYTSDDDSAPGVPFRLDGTSFMHRFRCLIPGTIAIHANMKAMTPLHEFQHAISSYTNGCLVDLYVNGDIAVNNKRRATSQAPIPPQYGQYNTTNFRSDPTRDGLSYPSHWVSFHCELIAANRPALMDAYNTPARPEECENDAVTRAFVVDRIRAKISR